jgi:exopolysaccharide biosynthesis polyprenyl glycosylphosphotransferase
MKNNLSSVYSMLLVIGDFVAILAGFTAAYILRVSLSDLPFIAIPASEYARIFIVLSPIWIVIFGLLGLYRRDTYEWRLKELGRLLVGAAIGIMAVITYEFAAGKPIFPARIIPVYAFGIGYLLLVLVRTLLRSLRLVARSFGYGVINTVLVGDGLYTNKLAATIRNYKTSGYKIVGIISKQKPPAWFDGYHTTSLEKGLSELESLQAVNVILTQLYTDPVDNEKVMAAAQSSHCGFRFVPTQESMYTSNMEVELFQGTPIVLVHQTPLVGINRIIKRLFDIVVSACVLIVLSPIMLVTVLVLKFFGGGTILLRQPRMSRFNSTINVFKFRSYKAEYNGLLPEEAFTKMGRPDLIKKYRDNSNFIDNDPRISKIGRYIRSTSIDELPQLLNVLRGDISLVGPRALVSRDLENYDKTTLLLSVKSGITGLAQISGRESITFEERRKLDIYYIQNWSFWLDIKILVRTVLTVLGQKGAA